MKRVIWKFELTDLGSKEIELRKGYEFLTVQVQNGNACIWVLLNPNEEIITERFEIYGTGHEIHYDMGISREYLGTFQENNGLFVWHLFKYTGV